MLNDIVIKLLNENGKITLPFIGIFVKIDVDCDTAYLFTPSATKIDSGMVELVMAEMDVQHDEAVNIIKGYADFITNIISKNGKYTFKGVGDIRSNEQGIFYFVPMSSKSNDAVDTLPKQQVEEKAENEVVISEAVGSNVISDEVRLIDNESGSHLVEEEKSAIEELQEENKSENEGEIVEVDIKKEVIIIGGVKSVVGELEEESREEAVIRDEEDREVAESEEKKEEQARLNERFGSRRLGEIIEGGANRRFYDKVHSQVVAKSVDDIMKDSMTVNKIIGEVRDNHSVETNKVEEIKKEEEVTEKSEDKTTNRVIADNTLSQQSSRELPPDVLKEMLGHSKRRGLYDIYDKGARTVSKPMEVVEKQEVITPPAVPVTPVAPAVMPPVYTATQTPASEPSGYATEQEKPKKKVDFVLIISLIVIVVGLGVIAYFYYMQQELGL